MNLEEALILMKEVRQLFIAVDGAPPLGRHRYGAPRDIPDEVIVGTEDGRSFFVRTEEGPYYEREAHRLASHADFERRYGPMRRAYLEPDGPWHHRHIVAMEQRRDGTRVYFDCGHDILPGSNYAQGLVVGDETFCHVCCETNNRRP